MKSLILLLVSAFSSLAQQAGTNTPPNPREVVFASEGRELHGFLYCPEGKGPFPAIQWNHGSEKLPGSRPDLAAFYLSHGFVFFVPHRHGHGRSSGDYIVDLQARAQHELNDRAAVHQRIIELHELYLKDTLAAAAWLHSQPFVITNRIFMSGVSYGGIQTLLAAEADPGFSGFVAFAPAAMSWAGNPELRLRLVSAVHKAAKPVFVLQASNDYNLGPAQVLGPELKKKAGLNRARIYPEYGATHQDGHGGFACRGTNLWGKDVITFLADCAEK